MKRTRSHLAFGLTAALVSLSFVGAADAQSRGLGGRIQRQLLYGSGGQNMYSNPYYGAYGAQPNYGYYPGQPAGYGWTGFQPQPGVTYGRQAYPYGYTYTTANGQTFYTQQQPVANATQRGWMTQTQPQTQTQTQPRYDQQLQPTNYTTPAPATQRYQIPAQYAGTPAGYVISYGGRNYLSGSDGTMTPYDGPVAR